MKRALRWVGAMFGLLVFVLLVLIAWGASLPVAHIAACHAMLHAPVASVFKAIDDDAHSAAWRPSVVRVDVSIAPDGKVQYTEFGKSGQSLTYEQSYGPMKSYIKRTIVLDPTAAFGGAWTYALLPMKGGVEVGIVENGEIYNPVFRFVSRYFLGYTATMKQYLVDLGKHFGEAPAVECAVESP